MSFQITTVAAFDKDFEGCSDFLPAFLAWKQSVCDTGLARIQSLSFKACKLSHIQNCKRNLRYFILGFIYKV